MGPWFRGGPAGFFAEPSTVAGCGCPGLATALTGVLAGVLASLRVGPGARHRQLRARVRGPHHGQRTAAVCAATGESPSRAHRRARLPGTALPRMRPHHPLPVGGRGRLDRAPARVSPSRRKSCSPHVPSRTSRSAAAVTAVVAARHDLPRHLQRDPPQRGPDPDDARPGRRLGRHRLGHHRLHTRRRDHGARHRPPPPLGAHAPAPPVRPGPALLAGTVLGALAPNLVVVLVPASCRPSAPHRAGPRHRHGRADRHEPHTDGLDAREARHHDGHRLGDDDPRPVLRPDRRRRDPPARRPAPALRPLRRARRGGLGRRPRLRRRRGRDHPSEAGRGLHRAHLAGPRRRPPRHLDDLHRPRARRRRPPAHRPGPPRPPSSCARAASPSR